MLPGQYTNPSKCSGSKETSKISVVASKGMCCTSKFGIESLDRLATKTLFVADISSTRARPIPEVPPIINMFFSLIMKDRFQKVQLMLFHGIQKFLSILEQQQSDVPFFQKLRKGFCNQLYQSFQPHF